MTGKKLQIKLQPNDIVAMLKDQEVAIAIFQYSQMEFELIGKLKQIPKSGRLR